MSAKTRALRSAPSKPLRIEVVGSHSVGKSVLVRHIAKAYGLPILDEIARIEIAKMGGGFDKLRTDLDAVTRFQKNVFHAQIRAVQGVERYVSDRAFDNVAYAAENAACGTAAAMWRSPACRRYVRGIADTVRRCEGAVFFVRPGVALARDGVRAEGDLDATGVLLIDGMVKLLLELGDVPYVPIRTTNFQERAAIVAGVLRGLL